MTDPTETASDGTTAETADRTVRKVREGMVISNGMDKTAVVKVVTQVRHPKYRKIMRQDKKLYVHDETNELNVGDRVRVMETRPTSKLKRWRLLEIVERAR